MLPVGLAVANLLCAGVLHRSMLHSTELLRRRPFFESLAVLAFGGAMLLSLATLLLWDRHPNYVIGCAIGWCVLCLAVGFYLRLRTARAVRRDRLVLPRFDDTELDRQDEYRPEARSRDAGGAPAYGRRGRSKHRTARRRDERAVGVNLGAYRSRDTDRLSNTERDASSPPRAGTRGGARVPPPVRRPRPKRRPRKTPLRNRDALLES